MSIIPVTVPSKKLTQTISATATSFKLNNIKGWAGVDLVPADFGTESFAVFTNSTRTQIEIFKIDPGTIADPSITIIARGLDYSGGGTPDLARQYAWPSNDTTVQLGTDAPQLFRDFVTESNPATISALHEYTVLPESAVAPTTGDQFTNKDYVDGLTQPAITVPINQVAHGFVAGDVIRISGVDTYAKAQADSAANAEVVGQVIEIVDVDNFKYITEGVSTVGVPVGTAGSVVFLSRTTPGALVTTDTTTIGEVSFPLGVITQSSIRMVFHKYRPMVNNTIAGNPIASETIAGIVEEATQAQADNGIDTGETGARLFVPPSKILAMLPATPPSPVDVQEFTANDTYTVPAGATMLYVEGWGGGGSGGASRSNTGSAQAGGGGGGARKGVWIPVSLLGGAPTVALTVGPGGAPIDIASGASTVATTGNNGGNTTFGSFLVANGGLGGTASAANETVAPGGVGGVASGIGLDVIIGNGGNGGQGSSVGSGSAAPGVASPNAGGGGGGAASDSSSGGTFAGVGGISTYAGSGGAGTAYYQVGAPQPIQAGNGVNRAGGGGAATYQASGGAAARQLLSGRGGVGYLVVMAF